VGRKRGYDTGKKVVGRKRHIAVDTDGRLLTVNLTTVDIADSAGAQLILHAIHQRPFIKHLFTDGAYDRTKLMDKAELENLVIEIIRRIEGKPGFTVLPRRGAHLRLDDPLATAFNPSKRFSLALV
jgi:hypothetical protein